MRDIYRGNPYQFEDTITLFQYGFENFQRVSIEEHETKYNIDTMDFFDTKDDLFGDSTPLISIENDAYVILPNTAEFSDVDSTLTYTEQSDTNVTDTDVVDTNVVDTNVIATIHYTYNDIPVGECNLNFTNPVFPHSDSATMTPRPKSNPLPKGEMLATATPSTQEQTEPTRIIYIDMKKVLLGVLILVILAAILLIIRSVIHNYSFSPRGQSSMRRRSRQKEIRIARREARRNSRRYYISKRGKH